MTNPKTLKPLHKRLDFILSIAIPIVIAVIMGLTIESTDTVGQLCFRADCYENFVTMFKIPITISAIAFPLAGMVAAYHRSIETNEQIRIAQVNNTFSNFIKHRDDFTEYLESYLKHEESSCELVDSRRFYELVFPENDYTNLKPYIADASSTEILVEIEKILEKCKAIRSAMYFSDDELASLYLDIDKINKTIALVPKPGKSISIKYNAHQINWIVFDKDYPMENLSELIVIANLIKSFNRLPIPNRPEWIDDEKLSASIYKFLKSHDSNQGTN